MSMSQRAQVAEHLRELVRSGAIAPGQRMPTVQSLRDDLGVRSWESVRAAYQTLIDEGLVVRGSDEHGRGFFATEPADDPTANLTELEDLLTQALTAVRRLRTSEGGHR